MNAEVLNTPIEYLKGVGPKRADVLKSELLIYTFRDLLRHFPFRYIDRSTTKLVKDISESIILPSRFQWKILGKSATIIAQRCKLLLKAVS